MSHPPEFTNASLFPREQFRMSQLQVFNWGTFSGLHTIPIAERGFLFVGRSGSGKSTLLDAFSALLIPPRWIDFNAAAREADRSGRDRNLVTYIRGAWSEQEDSESGEIGKHYLRTGTTWSALALTYHNPQGQAIVLVQLFWLRGNGNTNTDVRRHFLIFERPFNLNELETFELDVRKLKQLFPDVFMRDEFRAYCERFCRLLGIENDMALKLLHKTQSAKNLGDLNTFLRDFMLDKPATFEVAERLVSEFAELNAAHQAVVIARDQVQTLVPARDHYEQLQTIQVQKGNLQELRLGLDSYRERSRITLLTSSIAELNVQANGLSGELLSHASVVDNHKSALRDLQQRHYQLGGDRIEQWEQEKNRLETQRSECLRKRDQAQAACQKLDCKLPESPQGFAGLVDKARQEMEGWQQQSDHTRDEQIELATRKKIAAEEFAATCKEVDVLRRQPSNIPADMLDLRRSIATAIGLPETALPFVGELIEVRQQEIEWQGAIERVLRGFALSLLVEEKHYTLLSNYINSINLGKRLIYFRTNRPEFSITKSLPAHSLIHKLNVKTSSYSEWLEHELKHRFDYACVASPQALRNEEYALTREGLVRHGKSRHEKDDRRPINDRRHWVLGFDNREKLNLFEEQAQKIADVISRLESDIQHLTEKSKQSESRVLQCQTLVNMQWQEIDIAPLLNRITTIEKELKAARAGNSALAEISQRIEQQLARLKSAEDTFISIQVKQKTIAKDLKSKEDKLQLLQQDVRIIPLTPHQQEKLDERFSVLKEVVTLDNLDDVERKVRHALGEEIDQLNHTCHRLEKDIENCFAEFKRRWPIDASDVDAHLASAPDFFAKLQRLEADGLPVFEQRFFDMLQNQSHQNLAALSTHLNQARKAIFERMQLVNDSLQEAPFNPGTYLHIDASDRQLPEVREFKQEIQQALSYVLSDNREAAEKRFMILRHLVERLSSQEAEQRRWRESVLDVRQHVEFIGREIDQTGKVIEIYRSGAGKSGGQRQKLATTCLAAALRYQLGGHERGVPVYASVILDEAFDKADNEFTALAMNIFTNFGFQMILATPLKSVMTLEPFIGGACFIDISERRHSSMLLIEYDAALQRLKLPEATHDQTAVPIS